jgi:hypothetical protein
MKRRRTLITSPLEWQRQSLRLESRFGLNAAARRSRLRKRCY